MGKPIRAIFVERDFARDADHARDSAWNRTNSFVIRGCLDHGRIHVRDDSACLERSGAARVVAAGRRDRPQRAEKFELPVRTEASGGIKRSTAYDCVGLFSLCRSGGVAVKARSRFARSGA